MPLADGQPLPSPPPTPSSSSFPSSSSSSSSSAEHALRSEFGIRDCSRFASLLSSAVGGPPSSALAVRAATLRAWSAHAETNAALEYLSELLFRARVYACLLRRGVAGEVERRLLLLPTASSQARFSRACSALGIRIPFWEDVVARVLVQKEASP